MTPFPASRSWTVACVALWLALQAFLPLRHWLIPGDVRATFEGLGFSWRLKAEVYRSELCGIFIEDPGIVRNDPAGCVQIDWRAWHGDPVVYATTPTEPAEWRQLPEVVVLLGPMTGERIVYNPFSGRDSPRSEAESRRRVGEIWASTYSRQPRSVRRTLATAALLDSFAAAFRTVGQALPDRGAVLRRLAETRQREGFVPQLTPLRWIHPGGLAQGGGVAGPFLLVEDDDLSVTNPERGPRIRRDRWRSGDFSRPPAGSAIACSQPESLCLRVEGSFLDLRGMLPQAYLCRVPSHPEQPPRIVWDYLRDVSLSKGMHISTNPFLLRRYARRVAQLWLHEYGRTPAVRATTGVSMNFRPPQQLVDPEADLANVPTSWWRHDAWVKDLEMRRIPR